jgi:hypothetical protein
MQGYEIDRPTFATVIRTLRSAFAHVELWRTHSHDMLLVCSASPITIDVDELQKRMQDETLQLALRNSWQASDVEGFIARFVAQSDFLDALVATSAAPVNTDVHNRLEYGFAKTLGRETDFSLGNLRMEAAANGLHRPTLTSGAVDWDRVALNRVAMGVLIGSSGLEPLDGASAKLADRAISAYANADFAGGLRDFKAAGETKLPTVLQLLMAHSRAELGDATVDEFLTGVERDWPADVSAIRFVLAAHSAPATGDRAFERMHHQLKQSPWCIAPIVTRALGVEVESAMQDSQRAKWLFDLIAQPYSGLRFEASRQWARYRLATVIGAPAIAEALAEFEPHVPWDKAVLATRAAAYAELRHPLANEAAADLRRFQRTGGRW